MLLLLLWRCGAVPTRWHRRGTRRQSVFVVIVQVHGFFLAWRFDEPSNERTIPRDRNKHPAREALVPHEYHGRDRVHVQRRLELGTMLHRLLYRRIPHGDSLNDVILP